MSMPDAAYSLHTGPMSEVVVDGLAVAVGLLNRNCTCRGSISEVPSIE